jgi:hypothetical protein
LADDFSGSKQPLTSKTKVSFSEMKFAQWREWVTVATISKFLGKFSAI